jgi:NAD(P)-dependent dehydrogenase (short-subunit alcohol dehydrogenase family)
MSTSTRELLAKAGVCQNALANQVAVITGAGRGIGRECAMALSQMGAKVIIAELDSESGEDTARLIRAAGGDALFVMTDVSSAADVAQLAARAQQAFGPVDILINNAIAICPSPVLALEAADWDRVMAVNLRGAFLTCKTFVPGMCARKHGTVVNMISTDAMPGIAAYIASKQGLNAFTQTLALEVAGNNVNVIPFGPGMVDTPGIRNAAGTVAPLLGMNEAQMLGMSLHPAFQGLMPAEYAGVATALLVAKYAGDYHGEGINGYAILERAGVIHAQAAGVTEDVQAKYEVESDMLGTSVMDDLCDHAGKLQVVLQETEEEFNQMPFFARPMAKSGFKSKAGKGIADWRREADAFHERVEVAVASHQPSAVPKLQSQLEQLASYYIAMPAETARFIRDEATIKYVTDTCSKRLSVIKQLCADLNRL